LSPIDYYEEALKLYEGNLRTAYEREDKGSMAVSYAVLNSI